MWFTKHWVFGYTYCMTQRNIQFAEGEFYHIYNRGNSKQLIFLDDEDRNRFIKLLYLCNSKKSLNFREDIVNRKIDAWDFDRGESVISIGAWVLMPNHFHLLVTIPFSQTPGVWEKENQISFLVRKVLMAYSKYFNKKYGRTGGLFETNFKSNLLDTDEYTKYMFSYIHLNPIKLIDSNWKESGIKDVQKATDFLGTYSWSSYLDYLGESRPAQKIIFTDDFPEYFNDKKVFEDEIFDWLSFKPII